MKPAPTSEARDLRALLEAVRDAITLPFDTPEYDQRLLERAGIARVITEAALAGDPAGLGLEADYLRHQLVAEQVEAEKREKNRCGRCRTPFDATDTAFDGRARHRDTPWCRWCIDNCADGGTDHACPICEPARYGGEPQ